MIISLRTAGEGINQHVVKGVLIGLVQSCPEKFGNYNNFEVTRSWVSSLLTNKILAQGSYHLKTSTRSLWIEIKSPFLHKISQTEVLHSILDELIINTDQTPSEFVATNNITMAVKEQEHISIAGSNDKRSIILTICESLDGKILQFQLIYKEKIQRSLPTVGLPHGFCLSYNEKHWSNEKETVLLIKLVLVLYIKKFKEEKGLTNDEESFLIWDAFKAQSSANVSDVLSKLRNESILVSKSMTRICCNHRI